MPALTQPRKYRQAYDDTPVSIKAYYLTFALLIDIARYAIKAYYYYLTLTLTLTFAFALLTFDF